jgi:hypothetical protein
LSKGDNRWETRKRVRAKAQLRSAVHPQHEVEVTDICSHGLRLETWARHMVGDNVWLRLPTLSAIPARVVWADGHKTGFRFERPLHPAVLTMLVDRHKD